MKSKPIWFLILFLNLFSPGIISSSSVGNQLDFDCDFDHDNLCGWYVLGGSSSNRSWHRTTNGTIESKQSEAWLITSQLDQSLDVNNRNEFQILASKVPLKGSAIYCLTFWYYLLAIEDRSNFEVRASTTIDLSTIKWEGYYRGSHWRANQRNARTWTQQRVRIVLQQNVDQSIPSSQHSQNVDYYYVMFVGNLREAHANIGLDDIRLFEGDCPLAVDDFCDFELNTCGWQLNGTQVLSNYLDHTTGTVAGHRVGFAYNQSNKTGIMTKSLSTLRMFANNNDDDRQQVCLQFFYYMVTDFVADQILEPNASILIKVVPNGSAENTAAYNISLMDTYNSGNLGAWTMFWVNFEASKTAKIEIESHRTVESTQIMIDDIRFSAGQCEVQGNCDFETDMCGWLNYGILMRGDIVWLRVQANSGYIEKNHLMQDHTTRGSTGNYLVLPLEMIDDDNYQKVHLAALSSPLIDRGQDKLDNKMCFTMWYFVQTRDTLMEAIEVQLKDIRQRRTTSTHATGTHSLEWKLFSVQFDNLPERFQIQIRVLNPENILSNVGIDDIRLVPGDC